MEMCLTGRMMDAAEEGARSGLVSRVVPAADLLEDALKTAAAIAGDAADGRDDQQGAGQHRLRDDAGAGTMLSERRSFQILTATEDKKEGMAAFVEKRPACGKAADSRPIENAGWIPARHATIRRHDPARIPSPFPANREKAAALDLRRFRRQSGRMV
jgi:hypothetical protein